MVWQKQIAASHADENLGSGFAYCFSQMPSLLLECSSYPLALPAAAFTKVSSSEDGWMEAETIILSLFDRMLMDIFEEFLSSNYYTYFHTAMFGAEEQIKASLCPFQLQVLHRRYRIILSLRRMGWDLGNQQNASPGSSPPPKPLSLL